MMISNFNALVKTRNTSFVKSKGFYMFSTTGLSYGMPIQYTHEDVRRIYKFIFCRYFEGQLTPISEVDVENASESSRIRVTDAAEKVNSFTKILLYDDDVKFSELIFPYIRCWTFSLHILVN